MLHFQSSEQMTSVHAPNNIIAGIAVACLKGAAWRRKHEVSGKCCCKWGEKKILFRNFLTPTTTTFNPAIDCSR